MNDAPSIREITRAGFLPGVFVPLSIATLAAVSITKTFHPVHFLLVVLLGLSLQVSMNVYNDIYDTLQGADTKNSKKSRYSGGSGLLLDHPRLFPRMFLIARSSILIALVLTVLLVFFLDERFIIYLFVIVGICIFLSIFYCAPPVKLAYRGFGEIAVWIAFGPLGILLASIAQGVLFHPLIVSIMPITGFIMVTVAWVGEIVDFDTDKAAGKHGLVSFIGRKRSLVALLFIHFLIIGNILFVAFFIVEPGFPLIIPVVLPLILIGKLWSYIKQDRVDWDALCRIATVNYQIVEVFSITLIIAFSIILYLNIMG